MAGIEETLPRMTAEEVTAFLDIEFPQMNHDGRLHTIEIVRSMGAVVRLARHERNIRPGGTLSGPSMMALADYAMYVALLGQIGPVPLAVTTSMSINFLRKPARSDLLADCTIIKLGRRLAVGEVALRADGVEAMVAHAVLTYSIPESNKVS
jgi:uncharacterized protein (TIGR00369 family)